MVFYTEPSATENTKLWDPWTVLAIINPHPKYQCVTCIGSAVSAKNRRCTKPINKANREHIKATLEAISYLRPESTSVKLKLKAIVAAALCISDHQIQAEKVLGKWQSAIEGLKPRPEYKNRREQFSMPKTTRKPDNTADESSRDLQDQIQELLEKVRKLEEELKRRGENNPGQHRHADDDEERERERFRKEREQFQKQEEEEKQKNERRERDEADRRKREAYERERKAKLIAQKLHEEEERRARARAERAREQSEEWDKVWQDYQERWSEFTWHQYESFQYEQIPWPVKSGSDCDVNEFSVREFFKLAILKSKTESRALMKKESLKWHPDKINPLVKGGKIPAAEGEMVATVFREVVEALKIAGT